MADTRGIVPRAALIDRLDPSPHPPSRPRRRRRIRQDDAARQVAALRRPAVRLADDRRADNDHRVFLRQGCAALGMGQRPRSAAGASRGGARAAAGPLRLLDDLHRPRHGASTCSSRSPRSPAEVDAAAREQDADALERQERAIELGAGDLRMSEYEAALSCGARASTSLTTNCPACPAHGGLADRALPRRARTRDRRQCGSFDGADRFVLEYFREECLSALEARTCAFSSGSRRSTSFPVVLRHSAARLRLGDAAEATGGLAVVRHPDGQRPLADVSPPRRAP